MMRHVEVKMSKCLLVFTENEMYQLLARDPELKRGKMFRRAAANERRRGPCYLKRT
mgnify:CR=1 FL=1